MIGEWRTSEHEHAHHLWGRRRLYSGRTIVARDGIASRQCLVGEESFSSTRFSSALRCLPVKHGIDGWITLRSFILEIISVTGPQRSSSISSPRLFIIGGIGTGMNQPFYGALYIRFTIQHGVLKSLRAFTSIPWRS
jgi:hypothetical protein